MKRIILGVMVLFVSVVNCSQRENINNSLEQTPTLEVTEVALTATPIPPTATPVPSFGESVAAVFLSDSEELIIYNTPGDLNSKKTGLEAHTVGIKLTGEVKEIDGNLWLEVRTPEGDIGWVDNQNVTPYIPPDEFCASSDVEPFLDGLIELFISADGEKLSSLISPFHGLRVRYHWKNEEISFSRDKIQELFTSNESYEWGVEKNSGVQVVGSFKDILYPSLKQTVREGDRYCNSLEQGLAADWVEGFIQWPFEYTNLNYVSVFRPAPEGDELNWRTFAFGLEKYEGVITLAVILQYKWDY